MIVLKLLEDRILKDGKALDNNILIEFIGKWHLGEDLNLYYFTDK